MADVLRMLFGPIRLVEYDRFVARGGAGGQLVNKHFIGGSTPWAAAVVVVTLCAARCGFAAPILSAGEIVIATQSNGNLYRMHPSTGAVALVSSGGLLVNPSHVLIDPLGRILTAERTGFGGAIVRVDPATGAQQHVSFMTFPIALDFDLGGNLVVANRDRDVVRVNPTTGAQTPITQFTQVQSMQDVDVDTLGRIVGLDAGFFNSGGGKVVRYDPVTQQTTTVATGGMLFNPADLVIAPDGAFLVSNRLIGSSTQLLRIDSITGAQQLLMTIPSEGFIAMESPSTLVYADFYNGPTRRLNLTNNQSSIISSSTLAGNEVGVDVFVPEPTFAALGVPALGALALRRRRPSATLRRATDAAL